MRNGTKRAIAGIAAVTAIMGGLAANAAAASATTGSGASTESVSTSNVIEFKGAAVLSVSADEITIKTVAGGTVTVKIGKDTVIKGKLVVGAKVDVHCVEVSAVLVATLIVVVA
jgi:hypothetical protein